MTPGFSLSGRLGIDFEASYTDGKFNHNLGDIQVDSNGTEFMFVRFTAAKTQGLAYIVGYDFTLGSGITTTLASAAPIALGVPQADLSAPDSGQTYSYGWVAVGGTGFEVRGVGSCSADVELFTTSVSGLLNSAISGAKRVEGAKFTTTCTADSALTAAFSLNQRLNIGTDA